MLSSNNLEERNKKQETKQQFALKKLTVGVASVMVGFTFMGINNAANADTTTDDASAPTVADENTTVATTGNDQQVALKTSSNNDAAGQTTAAQAPAAEQAKDTDDQQDDQVTITDHDELIGLDVNQTKQKINEERLAHAFVFAEKNNNRDSDNRITLRVVEVTGPTDKKIDVNLNPYIPKGYVLPANEIQPNIGQPGDKVEINFIKDYREASWINVVPATKTVNPGDPDQTDDMISTPTRTIHVINPDGTTRDIQQVVTYQRSKTINLATNQVTYGDWQVANDSAIWWTKYAVPQIDGYTSFIDGTAGTIVAPLNINPDTADTTVTVTYEGQETQRTYQFIDLDNNKVYVGDPVTVTGKVGESVPVHLTIPTNYVLDDSATLPTETGPLTTDNSVYCIPLLHAIKEIHEDKTVTLTAHFVGAGDQTPDDLSEYCEIKWDDFLDLVTGKTMIPDQNIVGLKDIPVPEIDGYTSDMTVVEWPSEYKTDTITYEQFKSLKDLTVTVTYTPVEQDFTQQVIYQDKDGNTIATVDDAFVGTFTVDNPKTITAATQRAVIDNGIPENWVVASDYTYPADETISTTSPDPIVVTVEHGTKTIIPGDEDQTDDMFSNPTRTIHITNPDGTTKDVKQTVNFQRSMTIDSVTGEVLSYGDWEVADDSAADWPEYDIPQIDGYNSVVEGTEATGIAADDDVDADTADLTLNVTYAEAEEPVTPGEDPDTPTTPTDQPGTGDTTTTTDEVKTSEDTVADNNGQKTAQKTLPQTGDNNVAAIAGLGMASLMTMFGFGMKKRED